MEFSFMTQVRGTRQSVWELYVDVQKWYVWEKDLKNISLHGSFETGSCGVMELEGMPALKYELVTVKPQREFWDQAQTPLGTVFFGHEILENSDGTVHVKHTVRLGSDEISAEKLGFLKQVFANVPDSIMHLKESVERQ